MWSSDPTQEVAPEPMYNMDPQSEAKFDEQNGPRKPSGLRVKELELQSSSGEVESPRTALRWQFL